MTHDKVRQDFEVWYKKEYNENAEYHDPAKSGYSFAYSQLMAYQAGRAAERAEIREKLESDGVKSALVLDGYFSSHNAAKAAITKILEVV